MKQTIILLTLLVGAILSGCVGQENSELCTEDDPECNDLSVIGPDGKETVNHPDSKESIDGDSDAGDPIE